MTRPDLIAQAVVEAARQYVASQLRAERLVCRRADPDYDLYSSQVDVALEDLQALRDALAAHSRVRSRTNG